MTSTTTAQSSAVTAECELRRRHPLPKLCRAGSAAMRAQCRIKPWRWRNRRDDRQASPQRPEFLTARARQGVAAGQVLLDCTTLRQAWRARPDRQPIFSCSTLFRTIFFATHRPPLHRRPLRSLLARCPHQRRKVHTKRFVRPKQQRFQCAFRTFRIGQFHRNPALIFMQQHRGALLFRQCRDGA